MSKESKAFNVQHLDIAAFAQGEHTLQGQTPLAAYPRFAEEVLGDPAAESVTWHAQGQWQAQTGGAGHAWLVLEVHTQATLTCQRCLQPVEVPLEVQRDFRFVKDEATAQAQDDDSEEDLLVMSRDGEEGFRHAAAHAKMPAISAVMQRRAGDCATAVIELDNEIERLGGRPAEHGSVQGALMRGWTSLKTVFSSEDDKIVLDACIAAEDEALQTFRDALGKPMPASVRALVERQLEGVRRNLAEMVRLRDGLG